ncbi:nucleotidyltransferase family protein [Actinomycetospora sp. CA-084318]|uniref:nucleotidyltransferase family protein n=1 Tax=Actinomycetospora sp. CA-084318 TaxID=3239892 RepID=UPI003D988BE5
MAGPVEGLARLEQAAEAGLIDALCERHGVRLLTVFGSTARHEPAPRDLDVGVVFEHGVRPDLFAVIADLTDVAGTDVDVVRLDRAGPVLRERALLGSVGLYESERGALATAATAALAERIDTDTSRRRDLELLAE